MFKDKRIKLIFTLSLFAKKYTMDNNDVFKKLRVALHLRDEEIIDILKLVDFKITKSELSAIFRKDDHPNYKPCGDQLLRNFLNGLIIHMRGKKDGTPID